ncbi:MAG: helix-turn-helix domain-containing protein [Elusimicrobiota bacterium]|nr:helix-turn-helix domain-containing protein [Elusimicrobiota bacterium]
MEKLMNIQDAADLLGIKKSTLYQWVSQHKIPYYKIGRLVKFSPSKLEAWVKKREVLKKEIKFKGFDF